MSLIEDLLKEEVNQVNNDQQTTIKEPVKDSNITIGIDLGTSNTCVSIWRNNKLETIPDEYGNKTIPSVIAFTNLDRFVGLEAKKQILINPENTYYDIKRLIGRKYSDESVQNDLSFFSFKVLGDDKDNIRIKSTLKDRKSSFTPEELSSILLNKIKYSAEKYVGHEVKNAVISVPAYFNDAQRQATKDAAEIAGLNCLRIINEPTAAALAYGIKKQGEINIIVYDLGGGTLDVSLVNVYDGIFKVISSTGNTHLGGEDFDNKLINHCINEFKRINKVKKIKLDLLTKQKLKIHCENAKKILSETMSAKVLICDFYNNIDLNITITREEFENMCKDLFLLCLKPIEEVLENCGEVKINKKSIDEIVLVGGATRTPKIKTMLWDYFEKKPNDTVDPDLVVSAGSAILGYMLMNSNDPFLSNVLLLDVTPLSLGIETAGGIMNVILPRNSQIPTERTNRYAPSEDDVDTITINVYEGERELIKDNIKIGSFDLQGIEPAPKGFTEIDVGFHIDVNGIISITATERKKSENKKILKIDSKKGRLSRDDIEKLVNEAKQYELEDKVNKEKKQCIYELESTCENIKMNVLNNEFGLKQADKDMILEDVNKTLEWLNHEDKDDREPDEYKKILDRFQKNYKVLVLRYKLSDAKIKETVTNNIQATSVYMDEEEDEEEIHEKLTLKPKEDELENSNREQLKDMRTALVDLCYSILDIVKKKTTKIKEEHKTELSEFVNEVLIWVHVKEIVTVPEYVNRINEVNKACNDILAVNSDVIDETNKICEEKKENTKIELEQLCYLLKCSIEEKMFPISEIKLKEMMNEINDSLDFINSCEDDDKEEYKNRLNKLNELCNTMHDNNIIINTVPILEKTFDDLMLGGFGEGVSLDALKKNV